MPLHRDAKVLSDKEQNTLAEERGAKRCRILTKLPSGEGLRRRRDHQRGAASKEEVHTLVALESHPLLKGPAYFTADLAAVKVKGHGSQAATGPMEREERDVAEERERQAHFRFAQAHLRFDHEDHTRASVVLQNTVPVMILKSRLQPISGPLNADRSAVAPAGCGLQLATGLRESVERGEEEEEEEEEEDEAEEERQRRRQRQWQRQHRRQ